MNYIISKSLHNQQVQGILPIHDLTLEDLVPHTISIHDYERNNNGKHKNNPTELR